MVLPLFLITLYLTMEFSWYMFLKSGVVDATRDGCRRAAQLDPRIDDIVTQGAERIALDLTAAGIDLASTAATITIVPDLNSRPARVFCEVSVGYQTLTGLFGQSGTQGGFTGVQVGSSTWDGEGVLPDTIRGRSVAVLEPIL
jgi:Flp pilus assembly protein TadG